LYAVEPAEGTWYPRCALFTLTGLHCPFCGATRCAHALLHGDLAQAAAYNVLAVVLLPLLALFLYWSAWRSWRRQPMPTWNSPRWATWLIVAFIAVFGIVRNLPLYPCTLLAPHTLQ
jgi:hypothetical protein